MRARYINIIVSHYPGFLEIQQGLIDISAWGVWLCLPNVRGRERPRPQHLDNIILERQQLAPWHTPEAGLIAVEEPT